MKFFSISAAAIAGFLLCSCAPVMNLPITNSDALDPYLNGNEPYTSSEVTQSIDYERLRGADLKVNRYEIIALSYFKAAENAEKAGNLSTAVVLFGDAVRSSYSADLPRSAQEKIRYASALRISKIQQKRGRSGMAKLYALMAELSKIYIESKQASLEEQQWNEAKAKIAAAKAALAEQERQANAAFGAAMLSSSLGNLQNQLTKTTPTFEQSLGQFQSQGQAFAGLTGAENEAHSVRMKIEETEETFAKGMKEKAKTFASQTLQFYLMTSTYPAKYASAARETVSQLQRSAAATRFLNLPAPKGEDESGGVSITEYIAAFQQIEKEVTLNELSGSSSALEALDGASKDLSKHDWNENHAFDVMGLGLAIGYMPPSSFTYTGYTGPKGLDKETRTVSWGASTMYQICFMTHRPVRTALGRPAWFGEMFNLYYRTAAASATNSGGAKIAGVDRVTEFGEYSTFGYGIGISPESSSFRLIPSLNLGISTPGVISTNDSSGHYSTKTLVFASPEIIPAMNINEKMRLAVRVPTKYWQFSMDGASWSRPLVYMFNYNFAY